MLFEQFPKGSPFAGELRHYFSSKPTVKVQSDFFDCGWQWGFAVETPDGNRFGCKLPRFLNMGRKDARRLIKMLQHKLNLEAYTS